VDVGPSLVEAGEGVLGEDRIILEVKFIVVELAFVVSELEGVVLDLENVVDLGEVLPRVIEHALNVLFPVEQHQ